MKLVVVLTELGIHEVVEDEQQNAVEGREEHSKRIIESDGQVIATPVAEEDVVEEEQITERAPWARLTVDAAWATNADEHRA